MFPIITEQRQKRYEQLNINKEDQTPVICCYYGRACRRMNDPAGANRALCMRCGLADAIDEGYFLRLEQMGVQ
jgi:hypothetical protein